MHQFLIGLLECPQCHRSLNWRIDEQASDRIQRAEAQCRGCAAVYPIRDGIGIFLTPDLPRNDLWEQVESQLTIYLRENPDLERQLMGTPLEELSPTDQHFRALVLEERGDFSGAREAEALANRNLYTLAYSECWASQVEHTLAALEALDGPVVDLASGRCYLVEKIVERFDRPVVATDFSLSVLRRDKKLFEYLGLERSVSLMAFDARLTPFRDGSLNTLTTNLGLPNMEDPGRLLLELDRIVDGTMLAISHFFPLDDELNKEVIEDAGLGPLLYRQSAVERFVSAGWCVDLENTCVAKALPTPASTVIEGARADGLPVAPTELEWCVLRASNTDSFGIK
jgi:uncharacterized protein YbaR (Trm112 family)